MLTVWIRRADLAFNFAETGGVLGLQRRSAATHLPWIGKRSVGAKDAEKKGSLSVDTGKHE
jgi:hypothetical protein